MTKTSSLKWRDLFGITILHSARVLETIFSPPFLRCVLYPAAAVMACCDIFGRRHNVNFHVFPTTWPKVKANITNLFRIRVRYHLSRVIANWPDRLGTPRWQRRFKIQGNSLEDAVKAGRPVILVSAHFGPIHLGGYFLRASGFRVATYIGNSDEMHSASRRAKDRLSHFPDMPHVFSAQDNLREVYRFLEQGNILRTAFDVKVGKMVQVALCDRSVCFATGPIRLATATGADLIPYVISEYAPWKFVLHVGRPVPSEFLNPSSPNNAATHVVNECGRFFQSSPDEASGELLAAFTHSEPCPESIAP